MSREKELAKNTAILTLGKMCTQCISFLLLPLYTALLDTSEYGTYDLLLTYATLLLPLVNWQFDQGIFRFMLDCRGNQGKQKELFSTVLVASTLQAFCYAVIIVMMIKLFHLSHGYFLLTYVVLQVYSSLLLQFIRGLGKHKSYAIVSFLSATITIITNVITLAIFRMGITGLFVSSYTTLVFSISYMIITSKVWQYISVSSINRKVYRKVCVYSLPLIPNNLAWWVVSVSDRTIISFILGVAINGIYTVANKFSNVFISFYNIFNLSWTESVSLHYQDEDRDYFLSDMITTMYKLFSCACLGIVACMPFIFPMMVNERYLEAYPQIIILMYAMLFRVIVGLYSCVYIAMKESKKIAYTSMTSAVINISIHLLLINKIGLYAASISTLVAFGSMAVIRYIDINRTIKMKIASPVLLSSIFLALVLIYTYYKNNIFFNIIMLAIVCIYAVVMNLDFAVSAINIVKQIMKK